MHRLRYGALTSSQFTGNSAAARVFPDAVRSVHRLLEPARRMRCMSQMTYL